MHPARITELLAPFLASPAVSSELCHSVQPDQQEVCHSEKPDQQKLCHSEKRSLVPSELCHSEKRSAEEPAVLSPSQLHAISTYIDLLLRWNARINLTAVRDPEEIVTRHFGESLFAARILFPQGSAALQGADASANDQRPDQRPATNDHPSVADIGSGAGFPGLPIKLWAPHIALTLIESNQKKATFLREAARALTLTNVNIQTARAEALAGSYFAIVTLRAVERFQSILPVAASLIAPAGRLALLISSAQLDQARAALPNFSWSTPSPVPLSKSRVLAMAYRPR